ncbi:MAG: PQQ-binding-like beta-propeller repeat protein [Phycisphaerae bacterium]
MIARHTTRLRALAGAVLCAGAAMLCPPSSRAIDPPAADPARPPLDGPDPDVYIHDSFEAEELIAKAQRQARAGQWSSACRNLLQVIHRHGDMLTRVADGPYTAVCRRVNQLVSDWPAEGLVEFRRQADLPAGTALQQARSQRSIEALLWVAQRYFATSAGLEALDTVGQLAIEAGDFGLAQQVYDRLLSEHPDRQVEQARLVGRLAIVYALESRPDAAGRQVERAGPDAKVQWMGQPQALAGLVQTLLDQVHPAERPPAPFAWPTFAGNDRRHRDVELTLDRLAVLWQVPGIGEAAAVPEPDRSSNFRRALRRGRFLSTFPAVADKTLFLQDGRDLRAIQLGNGRTLWRSSGQDPENGRTVSSDTDVPRWHALAVDRGRVYACVGSEFVPFYGYDAPANTSALLCLDAATGQKLWRADNRSLGPDFDEMSFESIPIIVGTKVYAIARRKRAFGFEDCFLYCLNAETGQIQYRTHLGSASTGGFGYRRPTLTIPALADHTVYVVSNLGTIAAVDRFTGLIAWLRLYPRISEAQWRREGRGDSRELNPWQYNPVIVSGDRLIVLPTDADALMVLDRGTGALLQDIPIQELHAVQSILGLEGDRIYAVGDEAFCYDLAAGSYVWQSPLPGDGEVFGRGLLTTDRLLVPTRSALGAFDRWNGSVTRYPWMPDQQGGNLLSAPGLLLVTDSTTLTAYARKQDVLARLHRKMDAAPDDPEPALDLAEVLFRTGDVAESIAALDQAIARAGGFARSIAAPTKTRLFEDCLHFADRLGKRDEPDLATIIGLYERASQCPPDTRAHLTYRIRWADLYRQAGRFADAVALYQQIIADRSLAQADSIADADPKPVAAGRWAESAIAELIGDHGRQVYARFDTQADQWLQAGQAGRDLDRLAQVAERFPNALAAPKALLARATLLHENGKPLQAAGTFYNALARYRSLLDPPAVMKDIADCYRDGGQPENAWRWLTKAARQYPTATVREGDRNISLLEYRDRLGDLSERLAPARPTLDPPLADADPHRFDQQCHLLDPMFADQPGTDWGLALVHSDGHLHALNPRNNKPVWPNPAPCPHLPRLLLAGRDHLILADRYRVFAIRAADGSQRWQVGQRPAGVDEPEADPEDFPGLTGFALHGDTMVALRSDGQATAIDVSTGQVRWQRSLDHHAIGPMAIDGQWLAYPAMFNGQAICALYATRDGSPAGIIETDGDRHIAKPLLTLEGNVILVGSETVDCYEPGSGRRLWSVHPEEGVLPGSIVLDVDGLYLADDRLAIQKLSLTDGRTLWRTPSPVRGRWRGTEGISVVLHQGQLVVATERRLFALSTREGRVLWEGTVPEGTHFSTRLITQNFLLAVDTPPEHFDEPFSVYFYDLRNASGLIPSKGGVHTLGRFEEVQEVTVRNGALLLQTPHAVYAWPANPGS